MKCPCCNGTGRTPMVTIVKTDSGLPCDFPCIECYGTGEVEMTNEYFLQTATTEELAGAIYEWYSQGHIEGKVGKQLSSVTRVVEWLKEIHK